MTTIHGAVPSSRLGAALAALPALAIALAAATSAAQEPARADSAVACDGTRISAVEIVPEPPRFIEESAPAWSRGALRILLGSRTTRPSVVESFLVLGEGGACTEQGRAESERLLREQPFIADASVRAVPDGAGGTRLVVETTDEIPAVAGIRVSDGAVRLLRLGNGNVWGSGQYASATWRQGEQFRDGWAARYEHYHVLGGPRRLAVSLDRAPYGDDYSISLSRPFLTEFQRAAWDIELRDAYQYVRIVRNGSPDALIPVDRRFIGAGGVVRVGRGGLGTFAGALVTNERFQPAPDGVVVTDSGFADDPGGSLALRYEEFDRTRIGAVLGVRALSYLPVTGFDALEGRQDMARGVQLQTVLGRGVGGDDGDPFLSAQLYAGAGGRRSFVATRVRWEGRRDAGDWTDVVGSGTAAWWWKMTRRRTVLASAEFAGAWRSDVPFQLRLGDRRAGVRGYDGSRVGGARLLVVRAEHRWLLPGAGKYVGTGASLFADAGKMWAGDSPYGHTTSVRPSVGAAILAAVPRSSRRLLRLEAAVPLASDRDAARWELRFVITKAGRSFGREPGGMSNARAASPASGVFGWP